MVRYEWSKGNYPKKYKVVVFEGGKKLRTTQFGDSRYQQFRDKTPLKLFSSKNHLDLKRRANYRSRHNYAKPKYSAGWFALKYLW